tara:strand:- start:110 stop:517 length:408 start_codon:yes stop_codon:yes gene_type:complete
MKKLSLRVSKTESCSGCGIDVHYKHATRASKCRSFCKECREGADYVRFKIAGAKYGLNFTELREKYATPNCECCGVALVKGRGTGTGGKNVMQIDHCHTTGRIRGVICWSCNVGIGKLGDTEEGVERALNYLKRR